MYYQNYEDYMRCVLGYPTNSTITYDRPNDCYCNVMKQPTRNEIQENEELYPEIYKIVYPMVCKTCEEKNYDEITEELLEEMTNKIYMNLEVEEKENTSTRQELRNGDVRNQNAKEPEREVRQRRPNNPALRDLIRILILRELFDRRNPRPHFNDRPMRPPMTGPQPHLPGGRLPFSNSGVFSPQMQRNYNELYY